MERTVQDELAQLCSTFTASNKAKFALPFWSQRTDENWVKILLPELLPPKHSNGEWCDSALCFDAILRENTNDQLSLEKCAYMDAWPYKLEWDEGLVLDKNEKLAKAWIKQVVKIIKPKVVILLHSALKGLFRWEGDSVSGPYSGSIEGTETCWIATLNPSPSNSHPNRRADLSNAVRLVWTGLQQDCFSNLLEVLQAYQQTSVVRRAEDFVMLFQKVDEKLSKGDFCARAAAHLLIGDKRSPSSPKLKIAWTSLTVNVLKPSGYFNSAKKGRHSVWTLSDKGKEAWCAQKQTVEDLVAGLEQRGLSDQPAAESGEKEKGKEKATQAKPASSVLLPFLDRTPDSVIPAQELTKILIEPTEELPEVPESARRPVDDWRKIFEKQCEAAKQQDPKLHPWVVDIVKGFLMSFAPFAYVEL